jgi:hypothetical protein
VTADQAESRAEQRRDKSKSVRERHEAGEEVTRTGLRDARRSVCRAGPWRHAARCILRISKKHIHFIWMQVFPLTGRP